jgi:hypothetical protein
MQLSRLDYHYSQAFSLLPSPLGPLPIQLFRMILFPFLHLHHFSHLPSYPYPSEHFLSSPSQSLHHLTITPPYQLPADRSYPITSPMITISTNTPPTPPPIPNPSHSTPLTTPHPTSPLQNHPTNTFISPHFLTYRNKNPHISSDQVPSHHISIPATPPTHHQRNTSPIYYPASKHQPPSPT